MGDTAIYTLPAGVVYAGNFTGTLNCSSCSVSVVTGSNNSTIVKVSLPPGISPGNTISGQFDISVNGGSCGSVTITGYTKRETPPITCGAATCTSSSTIIGNASPISINIQKPNLVITSLNRSGSSWVPGGSGQVTITYMNNGAIAAPANKYILEFFCGVSSTPFYSYTLSKTVSSGGSANEIISFPIPAAPACNYGDYITTKIQTLTAASVTQCLCNAASAVVSSGGALPVTLSSFTAEKAGTKAVLNWTTAQEFNSSYIDIQRSYDAVHFEDLHRLPAAGNSSGTKNYSYTDLRPAPSVNYYRLRFTDVDGKTEYSAIRSLRFNDISGTIVYPNPASDIVYISSGYRNNITELRLSDITGKIVYRNRKILDHIPMDLLAKGTYFLQIIKNDGSMLTRKIQKIN